MITSPYHHSLLLIYVNLEIIINNFFNVRQGGDNQTISLKVTLHMLGVNDIHDTQLTSNIFKSSTTIQFCFYRTFSAISDIRQGGDNGNIFLHENILKIISKCILVVSKCILVVSGMINSPQLQSLILIYVNLGIFNRFFTLRQGGDNQNM